MQNTFKKSTFLYIAAVFLLPFLVRVLGLHLPIHPAIITVPVFGFLAYRSYRSGAAPAGTEATPANPARSKKILVSALAAVAVLGAGSAVRTGYLFIDGISRPPMSGTYRDERGGKVEMLPDGKLVATAGQSTGQARWSLIDSTRIRFEPEGVGLLGQVCQYRFRDMNHVVITDCDFRMNLTRM